MSSKSPQRLPRGKKLAFAALATSLGLLLVEGLSKLALTGFDPEERAVFSSRVVWAHDENPFHVPDRELFWRPRPGYSSGQVRINRWGTRGPDFAVPKPNGVFRVVLLGDSATFGFNVPEELTYARRLESTLGDALSSSSLHGIAVEVINAGVIGYSSWQGRKLFEQSVRHWDPDLVVALFGYNDHHSALQSDRERDLRRGWAMQLGALVEETSTGRLLERLRRRWSGTRLRDRPVPRVALEEFTENLLALRDGVLAEGSLVLFLTIPVRPHLPLVENFREVTFRENGTVRIRWMRQVDLAGQAFGSAGEIVRAHFLEGGALSAFTDHPEHCSRVFRLTRTYSDLPLFHYLAARCHEARGEAEEAELAHRESERVDEERREMEAYNHRLRLLAEASEIKLLDTARDFGGDRTLFLDVVHPSPTGHQRIAASISAYLEKMNALSETPHRPPEPLH